MIEKVFDVAPGARIGGRELLLIAGPCVAESLEICEAVAAAMVEIAAGLGMPYVFKASFDKANRSSVDSYRGPGIDKGLEFMATVKSKYGVPVLTDIHEAWQAPVAAQVADILQIPAFLCRQTDVIAAAAKTGRVVNIKKGQFMAPEDMSNALGKAEESGCSRAILTERGTSFGYHNLVVDMRGLRVMAALGAPVVFDATHSVQIPGGLGNRSGGRREFVEPLVKAAVAVGIDGLFIEVHPNPDMALSDGPNSLDFETARRILHAASRVRNAVQEGA